MGAGREAQRGGSVANVAGFSSPGGPFASMADAALRSGAWAGNRQVSSRTPDLVLSRFAPPLTATSFQLPPRRWVSVMVDRPTVWRPSIIAQEDIWFAPERIPDPITWSGTAFASGILAGAAMPAQGGGACYLNGPGRWWLWNSSSAQTALGFLIDATDPAVAAQIMNERGTAGEGITRVITTVSTVPVLVLALDRQRRAVRFQMRSTGSAADGNYGFTNSNVSAPAGNAWIQHEIPTSVGALKGPIIDVSGDLEPQRALWVRIDGNPGEVAYWVTKN